MKLVTDGELWAIKRWSWLYLSFVYKDLVTTHPMLWWRKSDRFFDDCWTDKETAEKWLGRLRA